MPALACLHFQEKRHGEDGTQTSVPYPYPTCELDSDPGETVAFAGLSSNTVLCARQVVPRDERKTQANRSSCPNPSHAQGQASLMQTLSCHTRQGSRSQSWEKDTRWDATCMGSNHHTEEIAVMMTPATSAAVASAATRFNIPAHISTMLLACSSRFSSSFLQCVRGGKISASNPRFPSKAPRQFTVSAVL
jgi:hypothetical protein